MGSLPQEERGLCDGDTPSSPSLSPDKLSFTHKGDGGWTRLLLLAAVSTTLGSAIPFGYHIGVINTPAPLIQAWCNESMADYELTPSQMDVLWSCVVSMFLVGGTLGSLAGSWCADYAGRKGAMVISDALSILSAVMFFICKPMHSVSTLFLARLIMGLSSGLTMSVMPMYLVELAPVALRGAVAVLCVVGVCFGVLLAQFMGLDWLLGTAELWHVLLSLHLVLVSVSALALPVLPESPKYLLAIRGNRRKALKELSRLRDRPEQEVMLELDAEGDGVTQPLSVMSVLQSPRLRLPVALVCALQGGQQCSGINAVFYYSTRIFESAGLSAKGSQYANLGAGVVNFGIAAVMIVVVNRCRRRLLLHISLPLTVLALVLLSVSITYMDAVSWMPKFSIFCVLFYVLVYGIGLGPIPYFIASELFEVGPRGAAMALGSASNWAGNLFVGLTFPSMQRLLGQYSFLVFAAITAAVWVFVHLKLPETFRQGRPEVILVEEKPLKQRPTSS